MLCDVMSGDSLAEKQVLEEPTLRDGQHLSKQFPGKVLGLPDGLKFSLVEASGERQKGVFFAEGSC